MKTNVIDNICKYVCGTIYVDTLYYVIVVIAKRLSGIYKFYSH